MTKIKKWHRCIKVMDEYITEGWEDYGFTREEWEEIKEILGQAKKYTNPTEEETQAFLEYVDLRWNKKTRH